MIITLMKANFANNNIGQLGKATILTNFGEGCHYEGPSLVEKNTPFIGTITVEENYSFNQSEVMVSMGGVLLENVITFNDNIININIQNVTSNILITVPTQLGIVQTTMTISYGGQLNRWTVDSENVIYYPNTSMNVNGTTTPMDTYDSYGFVFDGSPEDEYYFYIDTNLFRAQYIAVVYNGKRYRKSENNLPNSLENSLKVHGGETVYITATKAGSYYYFCETDYVGLTEKTLPYYTITKDTPGLIKYENFVLGETAGQVMDANEIFDVYEYQIPNDLNNYYLVAEDDCEYIKITNNNDLYQTRFRDEYGTLPTAQKPVRVEPGTKVYISIREYSSTNFTLHILKEPMI